MPELTEAELNLLGKIITGDVLDATTYPPKRWAIPGLIPEGFGLLTGAPKMGKSWAVLGIALAVAEGGLALGKIPAGQPRPVLYLALEDGEERIQWRARKLLGSATPIPANLHLVTEVEKANALPLINLWLRQPKREGAVVILDTLGKVMPNAMPGESAYDRDYRIGGDLKRIAAQHRGTSIVVVHHIRKQAGEDWMDSTSGTNGLNGAADFTINLHRKRSESTGLLRVTGRDVMENEYAVSVDDGAWVLQGDDFRDAAEAARQASEAQVLGSDSLQILEWVKTQDEEVSPTQVASALGWTDSAGKTDYRTAAKYLSRLAESGRLEKVSRGKYRCVHSVHSVDFDPSEHHSPSECSEEWTESTEWTLISGDASC